uniref:Uncharacterized protein n=1 Tax=mine drainage metagenome TaxID=410659 RepID=E6QHC7_9ZZZZ
MGTEIKERVLPLKEFVNWDDQPLELRRALDDPLRMPMSAVVARLVEIFGARLVAVMGRVKDTRSVRYWQDGEKLPDEGDRLRLALQIASYMLAAGEHADVVAAWFQGMNSHLRKYESATLTIADAPLPDAQRAVMAAAQAFLAG